MARGKREGESQAAGGVQWTGAAAPGDTGAAPPPPADGIASMLAQLGPEGEVMVERQEPHWCAGFCGTWSVEPGDSVGFVQRLQHELGGGVYLVRPLRRMDNGKKVYGTGSVRVRVAGAPRVQPQQSQSQPMGAPYIDATAREQPPRAPALRDGGIEGVLAVLQPIATRLAALEAAITRPAPTAPMSGGLDLVGELRKFAELRKLARELVGDGGRDDDDDDDDDDEPEPQQQRLDPEALLAKFLESKLDPQTGAPTQAAAPTAAAPTRPRLIRNGVDVMAQHEQQQQQQQPAAPPTMGAPPQPPPQSSAPVDAPANAAEAARAFAAKLGSMAPAEAVEFLAHVQASLPPHLIAALAQAAAMQAQQHAPQHDDGDDGDDDDDDAHAAVYR